MVNGEFFTPSEAFAPFIRSAPKRKGKQLNVVEGLTNDYLKN